MPSRPAESAPAKPAYDLIELLFFAYRAFVSEADGLLAEFGFGRAHHRALYFVSRHPGITVAVLLDILKITKQSLGRVLRELIEQGFISQREGLNDRRQRLLFLTDKGEALTADLVRLQARRMERAFGDEGSPMRRQAREVLMALLDDVERPKVEQLIARGDRSARPRPR